MGNITKGYYRMTKPSNQSYTEVTFTKEIYMADIYTPTGKFTCQYSGIINSCNLLLTDEMDTLDIYLNQDVTIDYVTFFRTESTFGIAKS